MVEETDMGQEPLILDQGTSTTAKSVLVRDVEDQKRKSKKGASQDKSVAMNPATLWTYPEKSVPKVFENVSSRITFEL